MKYGSIRAEILARLERAPELRDLLSGLRLTDRFQLNLVTSADPQVLRSVSELLTARTDFCWGLFDVGREFEKGRVVLSAEPALRLLMEGSAEDGMCLLAGCLGPAEDAFWDELFVRLNEQRNELTRRRRAPVLLGLTPRLEERLGHLAPDLWSIRGLTAELSRATWGLRSPLSGLGRTAAAEDVWEPYGAAELGQALEVREGETQEDRARRASELMTSARFHLMTGSAHRALELLQAASRASAGLTLEEWGQGGWDARSVSSLLLLEADVAEALGRTSDALQSAHQAVAAVALPAAGAVSAMLRLTRLRALVALSRMLLVDNRLDETAGWLGEATWQERNLSDLEHPYRSIIPELHGELYRRRGFVQDAEQQFRASVRKAAEEVQWWPQLVRARRALAARKRSLAACQWELGNLEGCRMALDEAWDIQKNLEPGDPPVLEYLRDRAATLLMLGRLDREFDWVTVARDRLQAAVSLMTCLATVDPDRPLFRMELEVCRGDLDELP